MYKAFYWILFKFFYLKRIITNDYNISYTRKSTNKIKFFVFLTFIKVTFKELLSFLGFRFKTEIIFGKKVFFRSYQDFVFLFNEIFLDNVYIFKTNLPSPLIIDVGSNIGLSLVYFKWLCPDCKIIAFEPAPSSLKYLYKNIESLNGMGGGESVKVYEYALSDENGKTFFIDEDAFIGNAIVDSQINGSIEVETKKLSNFIADYNKIDFMKVDIEGGEHKLFKDLFDNNSFYKFDLISIEYHHFNKTKNNMSSFFKIFEDSGFNYNINARFTNGVFGEYQNMDISFYRFKN